MAKKIFLIAGEHSGDALGAKLIQALQAASPEPLQFTGIGGKKMEAVGMKNLLPMEELSVIGLWEVITHLPRLLNIIKGVIQEIEKRKPDVVITIDLPDFNFQVASRLKRRGISKARIIHYVAPSVWAWRPKRAQRIAGFLDGLMCLLPFEPAHFPGLRAEWVGHPLIESKLDEGNRDVFREKYDIPEGTKILGLFFGSRPSELKSMSSILKDVALAVREYDPNVHVIIPTLPSLEFEVLKMIENFDCPTNVIARTDARADMFAACDAAVAVSGTIALELAYAGVPHVILYKSHPVTWILIKTLVKVKYAHLANILLNERAIPEFLQGKAEPIQIARAVLMLLKKPQIRQEMAEKTKRLHSLLGTEQKKHLPPAPPILFFRC